MASSPASPTGGDAGSAVAFALQEVTACWDQAYEALARGDLDRVASLMDLVDDHLPGAGAAADDGPLEAQLRMAAGAARGRLEHGMRGGLQGLHDEIARVRQGSKTLQGYKDPSRALGGNVERRI